jgi:hypothetical protein
MSTPLKGLDKATPTPPKPQSQGVADMAGDQLEELVDENGELFRPSSINIQLTPRPLSRLDRL